MIYGVAPATLPLVMETPTPPPSPPLPPPLQLARLVDRPHAVNSRLSAQLGQRRQPTLIYVIVAQRRPRPERVALATVA